MNKNITFKNFIKQYLLERKFKLSDASILRYDRSLRMFLDFVGDKQILKNIDGRLISKWSVLRLEKGLSPLSVNCDLRHLKACLNQAYKWGYIKYPVIIEMVKTPSRLPRHLSENDFDKILQSETDDFLRKIWIFFVYTGLRRSELVSLKWSDVFIGNDKSYIEVIGKGNKQRTVPLLPKVIDIIGKSGNTEFVFPNITADYLTRKFKITARLANLDCHLHDLRHTCFTWFAGRGVPLKMIQDIAGHTSIMTTLQYCKIFTGESYKILCNCFKN